MGEKRSFEREATDGRTGERTRMCKLAYLRRLRSHQLRIEGLSVMLGAPWVTSDRNEVSQREEVEAWMLTGTQLQG